jgi:predicted CoA-substrate-specific enzyme activase
VGSTAVKVAALEAGSFRVLARHYLRHGTRQVDAVVRLLGELERESPGILQRSGLFFTGSGGRVLATRSGCDFVQEVNAVALATERLYPEAGSIVDIGGQDAKIIIWTRDPATGRRRKSFSMNDKCAGGTGSVIDRIAKKLGLSQETLGALRSDGGRIYPIAARCGVFAETDINGLQKQGVPAEDLLASLFEAIVQQNLSVLTRGATLEAPVLLLGGPHTFLPELVAAWRRALCSLWAERGRPLPEGDDIAAAVQVPEDACFFPAIGSVFFGVADGEKQIEDVPTAADVRAALERGRRSPESEMGEPGLLRGAAEREEIRELARQEAPEGFSIHAGQDCEAVIGLDAGSTSTKAVLCDLDGRLLAKSYRLSQGDPLADTREVLADLKRQAGEANCRLSVRALGVTGYAKDMLGEFLGADLVLVETVAHARSALAVDPACEVITDVGGQDIKVLVLRNGRVRDFRLNSQCSAGNGYFLQSTAARFGIPIEQFADRAFRAERCPHFSFGCAVFLEADIANFQQIGWTADEILAGLARVLPQNVWLYVVGEPNLARLGRSFILQGGTQRNEAVVKAEVDFIRERVPDARIRVHPHAGESGAIGVALELLRRGVGRESSRFIGFESLRGLRVRTRQDESTRCDRCTNRCERTFLEAELPDGSVRRFVIASCEVGRVVSGDTSAKSPAGSGTRPVAGKPRPDFSARAARLAFAPSPEVEVGVARERVAADRWGALPWLRRAGMARKQRDTVRIGIPRAVNLHQTAPFFIAYLQALGVSPDRILVSGTTTEALFRRGARRGAVDTCYPSKVALAHVHDLVYERKPDWIFFPILVNLPTDVRGAQDASVCPTSQATPAVVRAAFTRERDVFAENGMGYFTPVFHMGEPVLFEREMLRFWGERLGVTAGENRRAMQVAYAADVRTLERRLRRPALREIRRLEAAGQVGIVVLGRPYHNDPGLNHRIFRDLNRLGYPIFCIASLPRDAKMLAEIFGDDLAAGRIRDPMQICDVWRNSFSANSNVKLWAAKLVARHPNLVALDVSSFRCGHDAPIYGTLESIIESSGTPYFAFHEIDENRPTGAIRLRVETIDYFLREYEARCLRKPQAGAPTVKEEVLLDVLEEALI